MTVGRGGGEILDLPLAFADAFVSSERAIRRVLLDMALQAGSPAIDVGSNALVPGGVTYDQRGAGFPRIVNTTVDIGSVEYAGAAPIAPFVPVPASSIWSKGLLGLLAGLFGMLAMRRRRGSSSA
ncbi:MAG: choice-of-anchor Q domain-containing protein [Rhodanobacteraceae bacterium]